MPFSCEPCWFLNNTVLLHGPFLFQPDETEFFPHREGGCELKEQLESGVKNFTAGTQVWIDKFLVVSHDKDRTVVEPNKEEYEKACRYLGVFVLVSNSVKDCEEALVTYRRWEESEGHFRPSKRKAACHIRMSGIH